MKNDFQDYIHSIATKFSDKQTSEMGYRTDFEKLLESFFSKEQKFYIHHDAKVVSGNKPDFVVLKNQVPILYIENKDIGIDLDKVEKSNQIDRYFGYANLILTDQLEFRFYRNGEKYNESIRIATLNKKDRTIDSIPENFELLRKTVLDFTLSHKEPIKRGKHLAQIMGGKAKRIRASVLEVLDKSEETDIHKVRNTIKKLLVHDMDNFAFADMYAQTLIYGLFVSRFYDETRDSFSRQEARDLVPKSNPFLAHFFDHISGVNFEKKLSYIVDELCEVFSHANIPDLMDQYFGKDLWGNDKEGPDPVIHFYEDFLKEYDPELRKKMGAYYTPTPVVRFMVRTVDEILQKEFNLLKGLADISKYENGLHKVQVLDPATGTGTFISAVIRHIYEKILKAGQKGAWVSYVHHDLLPRIHAFELMMGPYTIAHLKLSMAFEKTGFKYFNNTRLGIYLTNSLEESTQNDLGFGDVGLSGSIADESKEAGKIKDEKPVMVVIGNPPYAVSSNNKGKYISDLISVYKESLDERNIQPLSDDYIKFIRFAENLIEKNGSGVVAMITNNSFIDGIIHRKMRKHLIETFDNIYILNLSPRNQEKDQNVFDIKQGVSINIFVKSSKKDKVSSNVFYSEIIAKRDEKFKILEENKIQYKKLDYSDPYYFFVPKDFSDITEYNKGFAINDIFKYKNAGCATGKDDLYVNFTKIDLINNLNNNQIKFDESNIVEYNYRIFDKRYFVYDNNIIQRLREKIMKHFKYSNIGLISTKILSSNSYQHSFITDIVGDRCFISNKGKEANYYFPLYLYEGEEDKVPNIKKEIWDKINNIVENSTPENIFDYIYAVLHSRMYSEKYNEFLKIDFPRVPYPKNKEEFFILTNFGEKLRELHLMKSSTLDYYITTFPNVGSDQIEKISYKNNKVHINSEQYFGDVSEIAWNFSIGGYNPAQKWLKDRKGRKLTNEEIQHYQKIITVLVESDRIIKEIDSIVKY